MISVHQLTKRFSVGSDDVVAVDQLSFAVSTGEVYGLLGPNGAGKTTTLRMIIGLMRPDGGYAEVAGFRSDDAPDQVKSRVGLVTSSDGLYPWLTIREILLFFADLYGMDPRVAQDRVEYLSKLLGLESFLDRRSATLSTGQKQRANLGRALIHSPTVILLDEPTRGLDVIGTQIIFDYIEHVREEGKAVIVSTHRLDEAQRLCDRFGLLHHGRLWHEGSLEDLRSQTGCESLVGIFRQLVPASLTGEV